MQCINIQAVDTLGKRLRLCRLLLGINEHKIVRAIKDIYSVDIRNTKIRAIERDAIKKPESKNNKIHYECLYDFYKRHLNNLNDDWLDRGFGNPPINLKLEGHDGESIQENNNGSFC